MKKEKMVISGLSIPITSSGHFSNIFDTHEKKTKTTSVLY